ncbi:MAG: hypothetical protein ACKO8Q_04870 [Bacteroidota bacterium]
MGCNEATVDKPATAGSVEKTEDEKITEALVGEFYVDDITNEDMSEMKNITNHFYKDGKFDGRVTYEFIDDYGDFVTLAVTVSGTWKVKDKFIYYTYDKVTSTPDYYAATLLEGFRKRNTPDKVVEYDAAKVIYENADGKRTTMKKSY